MGYIQGRESCFDTSGRKNHRSQDTLQGDIGGYGFWLHKNWKISQYLSQSANYVYGRLNTESVLCIPTTII